MLRAKIDMASPNFNLRDPVLYRILKKPHHRTGDAWCIYPTYDYAHPLCDAFEGITHSICTLEFENHRPLYDWVRDNCTVPAKPEQIEFARLNLTYTVLSKRFLLRLVSDGRVRGWDDPRMPTIERACAGAATRRRAIRSSPSDRRRQAQEHGRGRACSSTACATTSTSDRAAARWRCCGRSRS